MGTIIVDKWVEWEGVEPPIIFPTFHAPYIDGAFYRTWPLTAHQIRGFIVSDLSSATQARLAGDVDLALSNIIAAAQEITDYLQLLRAATCTNKYRGITDTPTGEGIMEAWLEQAGIMPP